MCICVTESPYCTRETLKVNCTSLKCVYLKKYLIKKNSKEIKGKETLKKKKRERELWFFQ